MIQRTIGLIFFVVIFLSKRINAENITDVDFLENTTLFLEAMLTKW